MPPFRLIAVMATFNEERFIASSLEHLIRQGAEVYLIDNESADRTAAIAESFRGRGLIDISIVPRAGVFDWPGLLSMKERLAATLDADWFMHVDADEFHMAPRAGQTLVEALAEVDALGDNVVNFREFTFVPTREAPDHDHPYFERTMHWYYQHQPGHLTFIRAWKKQAGLVGLAASGGHQLQFPGLRLHPQLFAIRHYQFLSVDHAIRKYTQRKYSPAAVERGWHGWRTRLKSEAIQLPSQTELAWYADDGQFDTSRPRTRHILADAVEMPAATDSRQFDTPQQHIQHLMADAVEMPAASGSRVVCIAGMHRSGTSMVARLLNLTGLYLGPDSELLSADQHNRTGYWENNSFIELNDAILAHLNSGWDMPPILGDAWDLQLALLPMQVQAAQIIQHFDGHANWGWKDPRTSLTWAFWKHLLPDLKLIICLRNPLEVAESLRLRDHSSIAFGIKLWLDYNRRLLSDVRPEDRIITHYDSFFCDAHSELRRLAGLLQWPVSEAEVEHACATVSRPIRHQSATTQDLLRAGVSDEVFQLYCALSAEAGPIYQLAMANEPLVHEAATLISSPAQPRYSDALRQAQLQAEVGNLQRQLHENELMLASVTGQLQQQAQLQADVDNLQRQLRENELMLATVTGQLQQQTQLAQDAMAKLDASFQAQLQADVDSLQNQLHENELMLVSVTGQLRQQTQLAQAAKAQAAEKTRFITGLKTQSTDLTQVVQFLTNELAVADLRGTKATQDLEAIHNAKFWRVMMAYWRVRHSLLYPYRAFRDWLRDTIPYETRRAVLDRLRRKGSVQMPVPVVQQRIRLTPENQAALTSLLRKLRIEVSTADLSETLTAQMTEHDWANLQSLLAYLQAAPSASDDIVVVDGAELPSGLASPNPLNILFICGEFPNPLHGGGWRVSDLIKTVGSRNNVYLYTWYQPYRDKAALEDLKPYCKGIQGVSMAEFESGNAAAIEKLTGGVSVDIVSYEWPRAMLNYTGDRRAKHIITLMEVTSLRLRMDMDFEQTMSPRWTQIMVDLINALKIELVDAAKMDARVVVTHRDGAFLAALDARQNYVVINTGIKIDEFSLPDCEPEPHTLIFVGNYLHYPNVDAVKYFFDRIYPTVRARIPDAKVLIVGEGPTSSVKAYHDGTRVSVTGKVDDIRPYIQRATVCLAPLITGAGYRGKVHQYSALRRVCVATSNAVVDMAYQNGKDIFVSNDPDQFAERIIYLLQHPDVAREMGVAAFATVSANHDHQRAVDQTYRLYQQLLSSSAEMTTTDGSLILGGRKPDSG